MILGLLLLMLSVYLFLLTPFGQNWLTQKVLGYLSNQWQTRIELKKARFSLFDRLQLEGLTVYDSRQDTLLYAGLLETRVSNWFFLRRHNQLGPIHLQDALIQIQRDDSTWQHEQLLGQFTGYSSGSGGGNNASLNLRGLEMTRVTFRQRDAWSGQDIQASIEHFSLKANRLDLSDSSFSIEELILDKPILSIEDYTGKKPRTSSSKPIDFFQLSPGWSGPAIELKTFRLMDGRFSRILRGSKSLPGRFNTDNMQWSDLELSASNIRSTHDSIYMALVGSASESSGLQLDSLSMTIRGNSTELILDGMHLQTSRSSLKQTVAWNTRGGGGGVLIDLQDCRIDPADIRLFVRETLPIDAPIRMNGSIDLRSEKAVARNFWAQWGNGVRLSGNFFVTNWSDAKKWKCDFDQAEFFVRADALGNLKTTTAQRDAFKRIGYVQVRGQGSASMAQTNWLGSIRTQLGTLSGKADLRYPAKEEIRYQATLTGQLDGLGGLIPGADIRSAQVRMNLSGTGIKQIKATGQLDQLLTGTYRYAPIQFALDVSDPRWDIQLSTRDPNLSGVVQLSGDPFAPDPSWQLDSRLEWMDLTKLGWNPDGLTLRGSLQGRFSGNSLETLNGELQGYSLELSRNGLPLSLQDFDIKLVQQGQNRSLVLHSNEVDATLQGNFNWDRVPNIASQWGHRYFPAWVDAPSMSSTRPDSIRFSFRSYNIESYLELLHLPIRGLSNATVEGGYSSLSGTTNLRAAIPKLQYGSYVFHQTELSARADKDSLHLLANMQRIQLNDSISIPEASVQMDAHQDTANIRLMAGFSQAVDKADIRSRLIAYSDGLRLDLSPSTFLVQGKVWNIEEDGKLIIRRDQPAFGQLSMREGDQRIEVRTVPARTGDDNDIEVSIESLNLHDIAPFFLPSNQLEGLVSARIRVIDPAGNIRIEADTLQTRLLRFDNDSIGELGASLAFDPSTQRLTARGLTLNNKEQLSFDAKILLAGPLDSNRILLRARSYPISILERFLGHLFSDIRGKLTGEVELSGDLNNPTLYGSGRLSGAGLRVDYTNCFYSIEDADIEITPTLIDLDGWVLKDSATGNPIYLHGGIAHESFRNMFYDLSVTTRSKSNNVDRPVLLLNTDRSNDEVYYGTARGTVNLQLRGPQSNLMLTLQARASDRDSSYLTLLSESGRESGEADFLIEREYGREMSGRESLGLADNFTVDMEITANPLVNARVVLDELTGDVIRGRGNGTLKLRSGSSEPLSLRGRYNIEDGNYLFTFQSFFKKPFEIRKGGQHFIEWSGDPYDANIRLEAQYKAENVSFAPLANSLNLGAGLQSSAPNLNSARGDVYVNAELTGKLFQPQIRFSLGFPPNSVVDRNQELSLLINQLQKNPNELNRQVTYLIVFNSFAPSELAGDPTGTGIGVSTISGVLLNVLSDQINKLLGNLLKSDKYTINLNTSLYNRDWMAASNNALNLGSNINFSIGRSFFNNRFIISGGLGFDAPLSQTSTSANLAQSIQLLPDVTMEWLLNPSGSLRVGFFYRKSNDFLTNNTNPITARRTGGSLSYQREYDHLGDLFRGLFRKKRKTQP